MPEEEKKRPGLAAIIAAIGVIASVVGILSYFGLQPEKKPRSYQPYEDNPSGLRVANVKGLIGGLQVLAREDSLLVTEDVEFITFPKTPEDHQTYPRGDVEIRAEIQSVGGGAVPVVRDCIVEVVDFKPMPEVIVKTSPMKPMQAFETTHLLEDLTDKEPFPWTFPATHYRVTDPKLLDQTPFTSVDEQLELVVDDASPRTLRVWLSGKDPGIYWIRCHLMVTDGTHNEPIPLQVLDGKVPIAFVGEQADNTSEEPPPGWVYVPPRVSDEE